jgi:CHAT domain-containing protein
MLFRAQYNFESAIKEYEAALESYAEFKKLDPSAHGFFITLDDMAILYLNSIGNCYEQLFNAEKAQDYYNRALAMSRSFGNREKELDTILSMATLCLNCSDFPGFEKYRKSAMDLMTRIPSLHKDPASPESYRYYELLNKVRNLERSRFDFLISLNRFDEALITADSRELKDRQKCLQKWASPESFFPILARTKDENLVSIISAYFTIGVDNVNDSLFMISGKARCLKEKGDFEEAMKTLDSAVPYLDPDSKRSQQKLISLLEEKIREKDVNKVPCQVSIGFLQELENYSGSTVMVLQRMSFRAQKARICDLMGDREKAIGIYQELIREADTIPPYYRRIFLPRLYHLMGFALFDGGDFGKALQYAEKAKSLIPPDIQNMAVLEINSALLGRIYEQKGDYARAEMAYRTAVDLTEKLRYFSASAGERENFMEKRLTPYEGMIRCLLREGKPQEALAFSEKCKARALTEHFNRGLASVGLSDKEKYHIYALQLRNSQVLKTMETSYKEVSPEKIKEAEEKLSALRSEYRAMLTPEKANLILGMTVKVEEIQKLLDHETAIIDYFYDSQSPENKGSAWAWVITSHSIESVTLPITPLTLETRVIEMRHLIREQDMNWATASKELYQALIEPVEKWIEGKKRLIIGPYRVLHYLPFSALLDRNSRPLIDNHSIVIIPSLAALAFCRETKSLTDGKLVAFSLGDMKVAGYPPLPGTAREVEALRKICPGSRVVHGKEFVKEQIQKQIAGAGRLHFATHGYVNADDPKGSGLLTASGLVTVPDIMALKTGAAMVVLSACNTGMGKIFPGDDQVGIMRSFMIAGSPAIVSSLWSVSDESTVKLMSFFYQNLSKGMDRGEALRQAELSLMKEYPAPIHWAPFMVTGEWK